MSRSVIIRLCHIVLEGRRTSWDLAPLTLFACSGSFASVHLAFDTYAHRQVACKTVITKVKYKSELQKVMKEVNILQSLRHVSALHTSFMQISKVWLKPNINKIIDVVVDERNRWLWAIDAWFDLIAQQNASAISSWNSVREVTCSRISHTVLSVRAKANTSCIKSSRGWLTCMIKLLLIGVRQQELFPFIARPRFSDLKVLHSIRTLCRSTDEASV